MISLAGRDTAFIMYRSGTHTGSLSVLVFKTPFYPQQNEGFFLTINPAFLDLYHWEPLSGDCLW